MTDPKQNSNLCAVCKKTKPLRELLPLEILRESLIEMIRREEPDLKTGFVCLDDVHRFRMDYIRTVLETERGELTAMDEEVMKSLQEQELMTRDVNLEFDRQLTFGERLADKIAEFGGSWRFIIFFATVLLVWIAINSFAFLRRPFDPYPYILLNLVLSCLAAIQAPVIMMSQNRQEARDRMRAENDYRVNLKAELEIRNLHEKVDHLLKHQWRRLMEIQQVQMDLMEEIAARKEKRQ
jgi:uncharacterized membrane protein